jgi:hypothetical protein
MVGWLRLVLTSWLVFIAWASPAGARGTDQATGDADDRGLHWHATVTPLVMTLGQFYDLEVQHPNGRFGMAEFHAYRTGFGLSVAAGLGMRFSDRLVLGVELEHARVHSPETHDFAERIGAEFDPWVAAWFFGPFLEVREPSGLAGAFSIGYARLREGLSSPDTREFAENGYGIRVSLGKHWSIGGALRVGLGVRLGAIDLNPFGAIAIVWREPLFPRMIRAGYAGLGLSLELN